jgi:S1-C subfamily serine protease
VVCIAVFAAAGSFFMPLPVDPVDSTVLVYNAEGHGSGVIVGPDVVLTAKHVSVEPNLHVTTADGQDYEVVAKAEDPDSDAALLYVDRPFDEPALRVSVQRLAVGTEITVIGTPFDLENFNCVVVGRIVKVRDDADLLDAHCGPGFSGGPVLYRGRVIGILVAQQGVLFYDLPAERFVEDLGL